MAPAAATRFWLTNKRRISGMKGILERRRFRDIRARFYEEMWRAAASDVGAEFSVLTNGLTQIRRGGRATFVDNSDIMLDSAIVSRLVLNKAETFDMLAAKGLRVPKRAGFSVSEMDKAENFLRGQSGAVVVKPADGTGGGHGVTTGIRDPAALRIAARHAAAFHTNLLVEEQLAGFSYRLLYLDGEFIDAVRREPPAVIGDGKSSIRQLVDAENERRRSSSNITALSPLVVDLECRNTLSAIGLTVSNVPANGEQVNIKLAVNENGAAQNHVVRGDVHHEIIEMGKRVVRDFAIGFAGLDVTSHDISNPPAEGGTVFNEINAGPGIHHHYLVADQAAAANVAPQILEHLFNSTRGTIALC